MLLKNSFLWLLVCALCALVSRAADTAPTHAELIGNWNEQSLERGKQLYEFLCITCHGTPGQEGTLPTSRPFWKEPFKNGSDPLSIYRTLTDGLGQMPAWTFLTPEQRYDAVHYIREAFVRPLNPHAYFKIDDAYLASLPTDPLVSAKATVEDKEPPYLRMDFGPALFWTIEAETNNIAYKGIAVRLDEGPGGVSKGRAWMLYDHDTLRVAAAWTGEGFIDWRGIAFDGSHGTHASIVGEKAFVNPVGPGWANPASGTFEDSRFRGRDGKPYGPLPREWARYEGAFVHSSKVVIAYRVGDARVLELPSYTNGVFQRTLKISKSTNDLIMRVAPDDLEVTASRPLLIRSNGFHLLNIPAAATPLTVTVAMGGPVVPIAPEDIRALTRGGPPRFNPPLATQGKLGDESGPFAVDELVSPPDAANPWKSWMRFGGFDFFADGERAAICTWNGDVWIVSGIAGDFSQLTWKRIVSGLFQPLGVKIVDGTIYVTCRDQIARLHDLNGDDEIDFIESFNNDHQVTEHFHEFAMGLQTDAEGNFYYAKSARHALPALVPQHGTLLKVSKHGATTEIIANGFRAANGVCVNDDGTFFVTDQEGHWTPKNRINRVRKGGFYGNIFGYHDRTSTADEDMEQPLVWITNEMDRSPGELVRVRSEKWGPLNGRLLNLSYGTGRIFLVPHETIRGTMQGGVVQLPIADFPTGVMRGRFHPGNGHLYACGMYSWAGNQQADGGFYRVRATGQPMHLPIELHATRGGLEIRFTDKLDRPEAENVANYSVKVWSLKRNANYGSRHIGERALEIRTVHLSDDAKTVRLSIPDIQPVQCMEIRYKLRSRSGVEITQTIHNTIHALGNP